MGRHSKRESDIEDDGHVGESRTGRRVDGSYAGQTASEEDFDGRPTAVETRSQHS